MQMGRAVSNNELVIFLKSLKKSAFIDLLSSRLNLNAYVNKLIRFSEL